jgi:transposase
MSKKSCYYPLLHKEGQKLKSFSLDNTHEAFSTRGGSDSVGQNLLERLKALSIPKEILLIGLEAPRGFWENLYSYFKENGFSFVLLNPYHTNKFREALAKKAKMEDIPACRQTGLPTAGRNALVIAQLLRTGKYIQS